MANKFKLCSNEYLCHHVRQFQFWIIDIMNYFDDAHHFIFSSLSVSNSVNIYIYNVLKSQRRHKKMINWIGCDWKHMYDWKWYTCTHICSIHAIRSLSNTCVLRFSNRFKARSWYIFSHPSKLHFVYTNFFSIRAFLYTSTSLFININTCVCVCVLFLFPVGVVQTCTFSMSLLFFCVCLFCSILKKIAIWYHRIENDLCTTLYEQQYTCLWWIHSSCEENSIYES